MYTQCPHCLTLFRISNDELEVAAGKAKCCQCHQVFNALENLRHIQTPSVSPATPEILDDDYLFGETLNLDLQQIYDADMDAQTGLAICPESRDELFTIMDNGLETEPDYFAGGSESQMSELLGSDSTPFNLSSEDAENTAKVVPLHQGVNSSSLPESHRTSPPLQRHPSEPATEAADSIPEKSLFRFTERQKADSAPAELATSSDKYSLDEVFEKKPLSFKAIAWGFGSLVLLLALMLQLSWHYREWTIQHEWGRQLLTQVCAITGCNTPQRRDTRQILIQHRDLRSHPERPNALLLQLSMVNHAAFAQPYPKLQLSLFNDQDQLIAQRTFEPIEYLSDPQRSSELMQQSEPVFVSMELLDPGKDVTGFKFEFL